jgi:hypothetical protein
MKQPADISTVKGIMAEFSLANNRAIHSQIKALRRFARLGEAIEKFWLNPQNRTAESWTGHQDINSVMLATSLAPDGFLKL